MSKESFKFKYQRHKGGYLEEGLQHMQSLKKNPGGKVCAVKKHSYNFKRREINSAYKFQQSCDSSYNV